MTWAETFDPTRRQGGEPAGRAVFTGGYHLPAQHVIHSVGPVIEDGRVVGMVTLCDMARARSCELEAAEALAEISTNIRRR